MIRTSVIGLAVSAILAATVASMAGCDSSDDANDVTSAETIKSANVALTIQDENGNSIGSGSGILIAPKLVLTAGHLVAGQSKWKITASDGSTRIGVRGLTYDWMEYNSDKAHPRRHDVAVIYLDKPINLGAYPHLGDGAGKTRLNAGTSLPTSLATIPTFPHAYITDMMPGENLDTGGAVLDDKNHIVGVVTGRGLTTGKLYIARTDQVNGWVSSQTHNCHSGGSSSSSSSTSGAPPKPDDGLHVRTYEPPPESSSGTTSSSSGTTSSSSGTTSSSSGTTSSSSGTTSSSSGTTSSSSGTISSSSGTTSSSSGDVPPDCHDQGDGHCYGSSCDQSSSSSSSSSSSGSTSSSTSSSSGSTSSGSSGPSTIPLPPGTSSGTTSGSTGSSSGTTSSGSSGPSTIPAPPSTSGQPTTSSGNGSSSGTHGPGGDACQGPNDDSENCPGEPDGCKGSACGGGSPDDLINYGNCACNSPPPPDKNPNVK